MCQYLFAAFSLKQSASEGLAAAGRAAPLMDERDIVPRLQDFATVGHLYRSIERGIGNLAARYGEQWLFVGPPRAQAAPEHFGWPPTAARPSGPKRFR